jgi:hypothetical protein
MRLGDNLAKPAGNRYDFAGNPSGVRGCEKRYDWWDVVPLADTSQGWMFGDTRADAFRVAGYHRNLIY